MCRIMCSCLSILCSRLLVGTVVKLTGNFQIYIYVSKVSNMSVVNCIISELVNEMVANAVDIATNHLMQRIFSSPLSNLSSLSAISTTPTSDGSSTDKSLEGPSDDPVLAAVVNQELPVTPSRNVGANGFGGEPRRLYDENKPDYYGGEQM